MPAMQLNELARHLHRLRRWRQHRRPGSLLPLLLLPLLLLPLLLLPLLFVVLSLFARQPLEVALMPFHVWPPVPHRGAGLRAALCDRGCGAARRPAAAAARRLNSTHAAGRRRGRDRPSAVADARRPAPRPHRDTLGSRRR